MKTSETHEIRICNLTTEIEMLTANNAKQKIEFGNIDNELKKTNADAEERFSSLTLKIDELTANNAKQNREFKNNVKEMEKPNVEFEARICNLTSKIEELTSNNTKMNLEYLNDRLEKFMEAVAVETSETQRRHFEAKDLLQEQITSLATRTVSAMDKVMDSSQKVIK